MSDQITDQTLDYRKLSEFDSIDSESYPEDFTFPVILTENNSTVNKTTQYSTLQADLKNKLKYDTMEQASNGFLTINDAIISNNSGTIYDKLKYDNTSNTGGFLTKQDLNSTEKNDQTLYTISQLFDLIYPIGSYYWTSKTPEQFNPNNEFTGTWIQIKDIFLWAKGERDLTSVPYYNIAVNYGATGGEMTHTLSISEMPQHNHSAQTDIYITNTYNGIMCRDVNTSGFASGSYGYRNGTVNISAGTSIGSVGDFQPHNNMPPFKVAYCWLRIEDPQT